MSWGPGGSHEQLPFLAWGTCHLCHHDFASVHPLLATALRLGSESYPEVSILSSTWPLRVGVKTKQENGKGENRGDRGQREGQWRKAAGRLGPDLAGSAPALVHWGSLSLLTPRWPLCGIQGLGFPLRNLDMG